MLYVLKLKYSDDDFSMGYYKDIFIGDNKEKLMEIVEDHKNGEYAYNFVEYEIGTISLYNGVSCIDSEHIEGEC